MTNRKAAAKLLQRHNLRIATAAAKHVRRLVPRYRDVDSTAMEFNMRTLLGGFEHLLAKDDDSKLMQFVDDIVKIRATAGFQMNEILMAGLALLPVLRHFYLRACPDPLTALSYYDEVEAQALPAVVALAEAISASEQARVENQDSPDTFRDFFLSALGDDVELAPFPPLSMFDEEEEDTMRSSPR
ncbi:MAG: hypothetical protein GY822_24015 [Deltaproteobacteria bacterium]|nr:hypothetical protein [Deltaproteobacteria bacterium]